MTRHIDPIGPESIERYAAQLEQIASDLRRGHAIVTGVRRSTERSGATIALGLGIPIFETRREAVEIDGAGCTCAFEMATKTVIGAKKRKRAKR